MTNEERARKYIENVRRSCDQFDEPLRTHLISMTVAMGNILYCIEPPRQTLGTFCLRCDIHKPCACDEMGDGFLDDGFGNVWPKCGPDCKLEIVRPGKVQCECDQGHIQLSVPPETAERIVENLRAIGKRYRDSRACDD